MRTREYQYVDFIFTSALTPYMDVRDNAVCVHFERLDKGPEQRVMQLGIR